MMGKFIAWDNRVPSVTQQPMSPARWIELAGNTAMQREQLPQEGTWNLRGAEQLCAVCVLLNHATSLWPLETLPPGVAQGWMPERS